MSKSFILGLALGLIFLIVTGVGTSYLQDRNAKIKAEDEKRYQTEVQDATPVQLGVMTRQQRLHSQHFTYYKRQADLLPAYSRISEFFEKPKGKVMETVVLPGFGHAPEPETPEDFLGELAHESDAVIHGKVIKKVSQVTEDDAFIFTDYDVVVTEILKDNVAAPLELERSITVTRPGGKILVNGIVGKATDKNFLSLPIGSEVLLFLKFIPETGAYKATRYSGSFELNGDSVTSLTEVPLPPGVIQEARSLLQTARIVSNH